MYLAGEEGKRSQDDALLSLILRYGKVGGERTKKRERRKRQLLSESVAVEVAPPMEQTAVGRIGMREEMKTEGETEILMNRVGSWLYSP